MLFNLKLQKHKIPIYNHKTIEVLLEKVYLFHSITERYSNYVLFLKIISYQIDLTNGLINMKDSMFRAALCVKYCLDPNIGAVRIFGEN